MNDNTENGERGVDPIQIADVPDEVTPQSQNSPSNTQRQSSSSPSHRIQSPDKSTSRDSAHLDAEALPIPATYILRAPACVSCRRRKVRCDKQVPCLNCKRALIPCVFATRPSTRPRGRRNSDTPQTNVSQRELKLIKRLRRLEGIAEELRCNIEVESSPQVPSSPSSLRGATSATPARAEAHSTTPTFSPSSSISTGRNDSQNGKSTPSKNSAGIEREQISQNRFGRLVLNGDSGSRRYVSNAFWAKLNDELDSTRQDTESPPNEKSDMSVYEATSEGSLYASAYSIDHHKFILGSYSADVNITKYHPLPAFIPYLWSVYKENVEPLIKVIHIPTTEAIFRDARRNPAVLTVQQEVLVFAIYYASVVSLDPDEVQRNFGTTKDHLLPRYRFAVEQALAKANFLRTSDITILQAFTIFTVAMRRQDEGRYCWSLLGLLIHLARGMGLHRDGTRLGLGPFETEMRRRIWWQLVALDLRSSEELGVDLIISDSSYDALMPSNINDGDISPDITEFPKPREGNSDCAVALARHEMLSLHRRVLQASSPLSSPNRGGLSLEIANLADWQKLLSETYQMIETKFFKHGRNENVEPLYWAGSTICRLIMAKICLVVYQTILSPGINTGPVNENSHRIYVATIEIMECSDTLNTEPLLNQFKWLCKTYTNWHAIAYYLIETNKRPWTPLVERGWRALNKYGKLSKFLKEHDHERLVFPLKKLFSQATEHRAKELASLRDNQDEARLPEVAERVKPTDACFGRFPATDDKMGKFREAWNKVLQSRDSAAQPARHISLQYQQDTSQHSESAAYSQRLSPTARGVQNVLSTSFDELSDDVIAQNTASSAAGFCSFGSSANDIGSATPATSGENIPTSAVSAKLTNALDSTQQLGHDEMQQDQNPEPIATMDSSLPDAGEDIDMLGEDFDWQSWNQSMQNIEIGYSSPFPFL